MSKVLVQKPLCVHPAWIWLWHLARKPTVPTGQERVRWTRCTQMSGEATCHNNMFWSNSRNFPNEALLRCHITAPIGVKTSQTKTCWRWREERRNPLRGSLFTLQGWLARRYGGEVLLRAEALVNGMEQQMGQLRASRMWPSDNQDKLGFLMSRDQDREGCWEGVCAWDLSISESKPTCSSPRTRKWWTSLMSESGQPARDREKQEAIQSGTLVWAETAVQSR